ncbi:hypothetical protein VKT23_016494 [Stygiomarasmius scandens]|uniref:Extracellular serine-rich protein n=1 Tax=Marasmiellus scandens TaxID=2682957 RepID=A0ABR1IXY7_9AGAR
MLMNSFLTVVAWVVSSALASTTITVIVGQTGSFYDPPRVDAAVNDTIQFVFVGPSHGVVQASFDNPCVPLSGGFSSGLAGRGQNPGTDTPTPLWNLTVTNASQPIWFYCPATRPSPHCAQGMVGAINSPSQDMYNQFKVAAQATLNNETFPVSVVDSGQGAFATAAPSAISSAINATTTSSSSTSMPTQTNGNDTANVSPNHTGAIAGGATAAGVVVILGALLIFYLLRRNRRPRQTSLTFGYPSPPQTGASEAFSIMKQHEPTTPPSHNQTFYGPRHQNSNFSMTANSFPAEVYSENPPSRPPAPLHPLRPQHSKERLGYTQGAHTGDGSSTLSSGSLNALAHEVAAVLMQKPNLSPKAQERRPGTGDSRTATNVGNDSSLGMLPPYNRS